MDENYNHLTLNNDCNPEIMNTKEASYLINYVEDFHQKLCYKLKRGNYFLIFLQPYVELLFKFKQNMILSGMNIYEAKSESLKEVCNLIDEKINDMQSYLTSKQI